MQFAYPGRKIECDGMTQKWENEAICFIDMLSTLMLFFMINAYFIAPFNILIDVRSCFEVENYDLNM